MDPSEKTARDFGVSRADFDAWRSPREGSANPTRLDNRVWEWLVKTRINAYLAVKQMNAESALEAGPTWCFDRFGQSSTEMPDGRIIYIAGEHEDYYDPDFYIYNDVVVIAPDGSVSIYGYPRDVFPPTDFHSATRVGSRIYVIGSLGYQDARRDRIEHIHVLDTGSYAFSRRATVGDRPPWIHGHKAFLSESGKSISVIDGMIDRGVGMTLIENLDTWELALDSLTWRHAKHCDWKRWEFLRQDGRRNMLWEMRQALWNKRIGWTQNYRKDVKRIAESLGTIPDIEAIQNIYTPRQGHDFLGEDEERYGTYRVRIDGVIVRYVETHLSVQMTIEGHLADALTETLVQDVRRRLAAVEQADYRVERIS